MFHPFMSCYLVGLHFSVVMALLVNRKQWMWLSTPDHHHHLSPFKIPIVISEEWLSRIVDYWWIHLKKNVCTVFQVSYFRPLWQFRLWPLDPATNRNIPLLVSVPHFCFHLSMFLSIRYKFIPCSWLVVSCVIGCNVMTNVCWRLVLKIIAQHLLGAYSVPGSVITVLQASTKLIFISHKVNAVVFCILGKRKLRSRLMWLFSRFDDTCHVPSRISLPMIKGMVYHLVYISLLCKIWPCLMGYCRHLSLDNRVV